MSIQEQIIDALKDKPLKAVDIVKATTQQADTVHRLLRDMTTNQYLNMTGNKFYSINHSKPYADRIKKKLPGRKRLPEPTMHWSTPIVAKQEYVKTQDALNKAARSQLDECVTTDKELEAVIQEKNMDKYENDILSEIDELVEKTNNLSLPVVHLNELANETLNIEILKRLLPLLSGRAYAELDCTIKWIIETNRIIRES